MRYEATTSSTGLQEEADNGQQFVCQLCLNNDLSGMLTVKTVSSHWTSRKRHFLAKLNKTSFNNVYTLHHISDSNDQGQVC